jgi:DNA repair/transcription protein MET18/MMS19
MTLAEPSRLFILLSRGCLAATPSFGPLAIPVFLEKLAAGSPTTKVRIRHLTSKSASLTKPFQRDTLQALATCLPVYGSGLARTSGRKLWNALKLEVRS